MGPDALIAIIVPITFFTMIFGIIYMKSRENLALIEKGINPKNTKLTPRPYVSLKYGLLLCGAGLGWLIAYLLDIFMMPHGTTILNDGGHIRMGDDNPSLYFALIAIGGGLGLVISYMIEKKELLNRKDI